VQYTIANLVTFGLISRPPILNELFLVTFYRIKLGIYTEIKIEHEQNIPYLAITYLYYMKEGISTVVLRIKNALSIIIEGILYIKLSKLYKRFLVNNIPKVSDIF
jgi:hypothetical protein